MGTKLLISGLFTCLIIQTNAQTIPNAGFENWTMQPGGYEDPDNWITNNYTGEISVSKTNDSYTGNFALQVINNGPGLEGPWPGYAVAIYTDINIISKISAYVKCDSISGTGKGIISVWGYSGAIPQNIGNWETSIEIPQYTLIEMLLSPLINYDSIYIKITGFAENLPNGTSTGFAMLKVDDVSEEIASDIKESDFSEPFKIFPNPFTDYAMLTFKNPTKENYTLTIYNINGQVIQTLSKIASEELIIERKNLFAGIYFIKVQSENSYIGMGILTIQ